MNMLTESMYPAQNALRNGDVEAAKRRRSAINASGA